MNTFNNFYGLRLGGHLETNKKKLTCKINILKIFNHKDLVNNRILI